MMIRQEMAKTLSTVLAGLGVGLFPALSFGLGLGDIQVESRLNQRLHARIQIVDVSDEEWQQIRARIAPRTLLSEAGVHPELLESINLRAIEDADHRHFIEVTSADVLTEPLFDLPVAVAGPSAQLVRNYSVLLDPPSVGDAPQGSPGQMLAQQAIPQSAGGEGSGHESHAVGSSDAPDGRAAPAARVDARAHVNGQVTHVVRHHRSDVTRRLSRAAMAVAGPSAAAKATPLAKLTDQQQLEGQLTTLQQMLTKMQATIAAQDAEIAKLTAQVAARADSQVSRKAPAPRVEVAEVAASSEPGSSAVSGVSAVSAGARSEVRTRWFHSHPLAYRLAGIVGGVAVLVLSGVAIIRRRHSLSSRDVRAREPARKDAPSTEPRSDVLAWQSTLREAQSGTWRAPVYSSNSKVPDATGIQVEETPADSHPPIERPPSTAVDPEVTTVATTVAIDELTVNLDTDLEALSASYESEHLQSSPSVAVDQWRAQKETLERDYLSDTESLPVAADAVVARGVVDEPTEEQPLPTTGSAGQDTTLDIAGQLRLLEAYHQEAMGKRDNFDALLGKLAAAQQHLTPAQLLHLEMLQRTLHEGKPDGEADFVPGVAV